MLPSGQPTGRATRSSVRCTTAGYLPVGRPPPGDGRRSRTGNTAPVQQPSCPPPRPTDHRPVVIGHRGSPRLAPENTIASFRAAWSAGVDWVEADVQPTADGVPVLLHDDTIDRTTDGRGLIRDLPWAAVRELTCDRRPGAVPRLTELLAELTGPRRLLLEIKGPHSRAELRRLLVELADSGVDHRVFLQSFERDVLAEVRALVPGRPLGLLVETLTDDDLGAAAALDAAAVNPSFAAASTRPSVIADLRARGRSVSVWTVDEPAQWDTLARVGVDAVITDRPGDLARHRPRGDQPPR